MRCTITNLLVFRVPGSGSLLRGSSRNHGEVTTDGSKQICLKDDMLLSCSPPNTRPIPFRPLTLVPDYLCGLLVIPAWHETS